MWENILSQEIVQKVGWTLVHFVWQAAAVALLLAILLRALRKSTADLRYISACLALGLIVLLPVITIQLIPESASHSEQKTEFRRQGTEGGLQKVEVQPSVLSPQSSVLQKPVQPETAGTSIWKRDVAVLLEPALPYIVSGWLVGVLGLSLWHLGGWAQLQRLRRTMVKQVDATLQSKLRELADRLGVNRAVQLLESALVQVPTVVGWLRPMILLPASALIGLTTGQLEAMLAHELAHIKRLDYLVNMLQTAVEILGFYHPAVWWVSHKIRAERENCCDDVAVSVCGDRVRYAKALTSMEEIRSRQPGLAVAASGGSLFSRIRRLVGKESANYSHDGWIPSAIAILLIVALMIPTTLALTSGAETETAAKNEDKPTKSLHEAAADGDIKKVKSLVSRGADVNAKSGRWGWTPLHMAARYGHKDVSELLILKGADVNAKAIPGQTPLLYAARYGHKDVAELLIDKGADVNAGSSDGKPLYCAAAGGHKEVAELLLARGADVNKALHSAAWQGDLNATKFLLTKGANINAKDGNGRTLLHEAAMYCRKDVAELLIAKGADVNAKDNDGATPAYIATTLAITFDKQQILDMVKLLVAKGARLDIHLAAFIGDVEKVNDFLEEGLDVNGKAMFGQTPLCLAALSGQKEMVKFLIGKGADINAQAGISSQAPLGCTPLYFALIYSDYEVVKVLIDNGADIKAKGFLGSALMVPLLAAAVRGAKAFEDDSGLDIGFSDEEFDRAMEETVNARGAEYIRRIWPNLRDVVELFLKKGADVNERALGGRVLLLHQVADAGIKDAVELFIAYGADVNAKDMSGWTPLHYACWKNHKDVAEFLLVKGADLSAREEEGKTPLEIAKEEGHVEIVELLRKHGAEE